MAIDPDKRDRVIEAAAEVFAERGAIGAGRRDVAKRAELPLRTVSAVGRHRVDLLRLALDGLPFPPVAEHLRAQASEPVEPALQALLRAARDVLGDPATAWDPVEIQAIAAARYDDRTRAVVVGRLNERWDAAQQVVEQLRGNAGHPDDDNAIGSLESEAAALHMIAVGLGLAMLSPLSPRWSDARAWTALAARLLETLAADEQSEHRLADTAWRARVAVDSTPAAVARLLRVLSLLDIHVVTLFTAQSSDDQQLVDLILKAPADVDRATIIHGISSVGTDAIVTRGVVDDAEDIATRVLQLCARLATDPDAAPKAAADLVLADSWEVTPASEGADDSALVLRLQWTLQSHVVLRRFKAPFTRTEQNRASALLELVSALSHARGEEAGFGWREDLPGGGTVIVRLGRPVDAEGVERMHERSSSESRYQRYFTPMNEWREENLRRISGGHRGATLVVTDEQESIVALGNVFPTGPGDQDAAEIALIVDDSCHGRGVGALLTAHLVEVARRLGFVRLVAYVLAENRAMLHVLEKSPLDWQPSSDHELGASVVCLSTEL